MQEFGGDMYVLYIGSFQRGDITADDGTNPRLDWSWLNYLRPKGSKMNDRNKIVHRLALLFF